MAVKLFRIHGVNDDHDCCSHCGKTGLKRVVWMSMNDADGNWAGEPEPVGTVCAAKLMMLTVTQVTRKAEEADRERELRELMTVHEIGDIRSECLWVIEAVGCNGGSVTKLGFANGLRGPVTKWAEERWPNRILDIRPAR